MLHLSHISVPTLSKILTLVFMNIANGETLILELHAYWNLIRAFTCSQDVRPNDYSELYDEEREQDVCK